VLSATFFARPFLFVGLALPPCNRAQIPIRSLLEFWVCEDRARAVHTFITSSFAGAVRCHARV
jgi:hypothetical protein